MRIYSNAYELMSETGRNLWEMGAEVKPKTYQNKSIEGLDDFITKELICEQYCLTKLPDPDILFIHTKSKDWADAEFLERVSGKMLNPGEAWKLREDVWSEFLVESIPGHTKTFDYTYSERMNQKFPYKDKFISMVYVVINLLRDDHDTRKAIINIYWGEDAGLLDGRKRIPCSMYYDFLIRKNHNGEEQLNICYHQRSSDFITHFGNDVFLAWKLMEYIAIQVGVNPGYLYHTIDSLHVYQKDWVKLKTSLKDL
jgi:thymidylate synthase